MKKLLLALLCSCPLIAAAQTVSNVAPVNGTVQLEKRLEALERLNARQTADLRRTKREATATAAQALSAVESTTNQSIKLEETAASLKQVNATLAALSQTSAALADTHRRFADEQSQATSGLADTLSVRTSGLAALLLVALLTGGAALVISHKSRQAARRADQGLASLRDSVAVQRESDLSLELLKLLSESSAPTHPPVPAHETVSREQHAAPDHTLSTKLADEIHRMRKRLLAMPGDTVGRTPLLKSLERLETELASQGYEIIDHTGKPYDEQMTVKPRFVPGDDLAQGERVITKVVSPQVNYKGVMLKMSDIEVSVGA